MNVKKNERMYRDKTEMAFQRQMNVDEMRVIRLYVASKVREYLVWGFPYASDNRREDSNILCEVREGGGIGGRGIL